MRKIPAVFLSLALLCMFSCASYPGRSADEAPGAVMALAPVTLAAVPPPKTMPPDEGVKRAAEKGAAEKGAADSTPILGNGRLGAAVLAGFLAASNDTLDPAFCADLALMYCEESLFEGINSDLAFAQMCLETGFLRYGNLVSADMNNFCGLGSIGPEQKGCRFESPRLGVRAHIQHLKAYACTDELRGELADPRFFLVRRGLSPDLESLSGRWAADTSYGSKIRAILDRMYAYYADGRH